IDNINLAAANDAMVIALCASEGIPADNDERMMYCQQMLERAMEAGMEPEDLLFDPLFLVIKGMQEKQVEVLEAVRMMSEMGLKTTGGLSYVSNGATKELRPVLDAYTVAMAMMCGLTSAIANPCDRKVMEAIKTGDMILGKTLYGDSFLEL